VLAKKKLDIGLDRMVTLLSDADPLSRAVAAESIGEEIWSDPKKRALVNALGSVEALLTVMTNPEEPMESLLPTLWTLRNCLHDNSEAQDQMFQRDGVQVTLDVLARTLTGRYEENTERLVESCLAIIVNAIHKSDRNSRKLLRLGLDVIIDLADKKLAQNAGANPNVREAIFSEGIVALAKSILQMLGPYNYVVCRNCHKKQEISGTHCFNCGAMLLVDVPSSRLQRDILKLAPPGKGTKTKIITLKGSLK
jgi:hypothetical protein